VVNAWWAIRDHATPSWDQSHYLWLTLSYQQALDHHGPVSLVRAIYTLDPGRAPLFTIAMLPFAYVFHSGPGSGMALNVALWPVYLLSGGAIAKELFNHRARLIAIVLMSVVPLVIDVAHTELQDFLLATLAMLGIWLIIRTRHLQRWKASLALAAVIALGTLTKISFLIAIAGPLLVTVGAVGLDWWRTRRREVLRWPLVNTGMILLVVAIPTLLWYIPNWAATAAYLHLDLEPQPGTVRHPLALANVKYFTQHLLAGGFGMPLVLLAVVVGALSVPRLVGWMRARPDFWHCVGVSLFLGSWLLIPIFAVVVSTNQDPRYAIAALPALAVITGGLISALPWRVVRRGAVVVAVVLVVDATLVVNVNNFRIPGLPRTVSIGSPVGTLPLDLGARADGGRLPLNRSYGLDVLEYLEAQSRGPSGQIQPRTVALLELQGYLNGNDLPYLAALRHDPFTFPTLFTTPSAAAFSKELQGSDFALYIQQPATIPGGVGARVPQLNADAGARMMTPADFALFRPDPKRMFVGLGQGQASDVLILERRAPSPRTGG
jgi:hypothetical protein